MRIPRFQRGLKWKAEDAGLLLDSIYRGYPIGTLLFWQTRAEPAQLSFGTVVVDADGRADAWWVVDGQQRVTSLLRILLGSTEDEFRFWFDLDAESFVRSPGTDDDADRFLPLTEVLDSERLHAWVGERVLSSDRKKAAFRLNKRVREYSVPAYIVETADEGVLRRIFERTNSTGKALEAADVFNALYGARDAAEPADFEAVAASLKDLQFGAVDSQILYRALLAIHDMDAVGGKVPGAFPDAPRAFQRTALAMRAAIVFVTGHVGMPNSELLPYKQPLVALAKFFDRHPEPSARSRELLARWIWRGGWSGTHRGDTVSTRAILDAIDGNEDDTIQRLLASVGKAAPPPEADLPPYNFRNARSKLEVLALLSLGPRHLATGATIWASSVDRPEAVIVIDPKDGGRTLANRLVHPSLSEIVRAIARAEGRVRASHAISDDAHAALLAGKREEFFRIRGATLGAVVRRFLESKAKWGDNDRPPLRALAVPDEA